MTGFLNVSGHDMTNRNLGTLGGIHLMGIFMRGL